MRMWFVAALAALTCSATIRAQEILSVEARPGIVQSALIEREPENPAAIALLFPGSGGNIRLRTEDGQIRFGPNNFLVRSRMEFVKHGIVAVIVDAPSDQQGGMNDTFRHGELHAADIAAIIAALRKRHPALPIFAVGTSRGTVSAAALARRLPDTIAGVVLSATLFQAGKRTGQQGLAGFDFASIRPRLLFAHHRQDECNYTPYRGASAQADRYALISVSGGLPAQSPPCEALSAHGFLGRESETVEAMANWMLGKPYQKEIN